MEYNNVKITGVGRGLPKQVMTNKDIISAHNLDTTDEWIRENIGIRERRIATTETSVSLGAEAVSDALNSANLRSSQVDLLIVATATPTMLSPSTACVIKAQLGLTRAVAFDVAAVCSGFLFGMSIAERYIASGVYQNAVVVGTDVFSTITDWTSRHSIFFGDGAGAFVLESSDDRGFVNFSLHSDSDDSMGFYCNHGETYKMVTRSVYDTATRVLPVAMKNVFKDTMWSLDDIDYVIPHQPSRRILRDVAFKLRIDESKMMMNMDKYANTVAASVPLLYYDVLPFLKDGDKVLFATIGSGWTYGAAIYEV